MDNSGGGLGGPARILEWRPSASFEETGLQVEVAGPLDHVIDGVALFVARAPAEADVAIDAE
jgi:hypothetical protein